MHRRQVTKVPRGLQRALAMRYAGRLASVAISGKFHAYICNE